MTDPISKLATFTPPAPNRDALLFAAGQASGRKSARVGRWWKALTGLLAITQAVTLGVLLWPKGEAAPPPVPVVPPSAVTPGLPPVEAEPPAPVTPPDPYSYLALLHRDGAPEPRERFTPDPWRNAPPLTAGSRRFE